MPLVHIELFPRDLDTRREIVKRVTEALAEPAKVAPEHIQIIFNDLQPEYFAQGGVLQYAQE